MSHELLLEIPGQVLKVVAITEENNNLNLRSPICMILQRSISVINVIPSISLSRSFFLFDVTCMYRVKQDTFIVHLNLCVVHPVKMLTAYISENPGKIQLIHCSMQLMIVCNE